MEKNRFRTRLSLGETLYGFSMDFQSPGMIEWLAPGWDYIWLDKQHGAYSYDGLLSCVRTAAMMNIDVVLRAPGHEFGLLGPLADMGPAALMIPMVNTADDARKIVESLRFPPLGHRSYWSTHMVSRSGSHYYDQADPMIIAQIETRQGLENAESIIAVEGIDCLMMGPSDLCLDMGFRLGQNRRNNPQLAAAARRIAAAAAAAGKLSMYIASDPDEIRELKIMGTGLIVYGSDSSFAAQSASRALEQIKIIQNQEE